MKSSSSDQFDHAVEALRATRDKAPDPRFVNALESRLHQELFKIPMNTFFQRFAARPFVPVAIAGFALLIAGIAIAWTQFKTGTPKTVTKEPLFHRLLIQEAQAQENFSLIPTESDSFGVSPETTFRLTSKTDISCDDIEASVALTPDIEVTVKTVSARECTVSPKTALDAGQLYQLALGATVQTASGESKHIYRWAYQAKEDLVLSATLPRNKAAGVPIDTGIDVTFNTDRVQDFEKHFTIMPSTKGRFEHHGRVWSFIPEERLKNGTLYTMTITAGVPIEGSSVTSTTDVVVRFETSADYGNESGPYYPPFASAFSAVQPDEAPVIDFVYQTPPSDIKATVYQFKSADELIERFQTGDAAPTWAYAARQNLSIPTDGLTKIGEFPLAVQSNAVVFPSGFERGYYLISFSIGKKSFQTPLVVSDLAASLTLTKTNAVLWLYDLKTGEPLSDATVKNSLDDERTSSDSQGVAQLPTPAALIPGEDDDVSRAYFVVTANDGRNTLVPAVPQTSDWRFGMQHGGVSRQTNTYWTYLWTDRTLYRQTDTVNLWGVLKSRENPKKEEIRFEVWTWDFVDTSGEYIPVAVGTAETGSYGTYKASVPITALRPGYYTLSAKLGETLIANRSFEVQKFTKPAYQILATTDKTAGIDGDTVRYNIKTQFFDGTPAPLITLRYAGWGQAGDPGTDLTTDEKGVASFTKKLQLGDTSRQYPTYDTLTFFPAEAAEGDIAATTTVIVYPSAVTFSPEYSLEGDNATVSLTLSEVDLDASVSSELPYGGSSRQSEAKDGALVPDAPIEGTVYEIVTTKTKQGTRYDFLEKQVIDIYYYESHNEKREDFKGKTDEKGYFEKSFTLTGDSYLIDIGAKDKQGRSIVRPLYIYTTNRAGGYNQGTTYSLRDERAVPQNPSASPKYAIGDTTTMQFFKDGEPVADEGTFLFLKLQNGVQDVQVGKNASLPVTFDASDIPNVYYSVVWFHDGRFFAPSNVWDLPQLRFDEQSRKLTVTVTPEQAEYTPGDTAKLLVRTLDPEGKPVMAAIGVSVIDEALAVIQWENPPVPLGALYAPITSGVLQLYVSHSPLSLDSGAEGGGGGGGDRKFFKDVAYFDEVETNSKGEASISFTVPDNITSWRITAQAVTENLFAGHTITSLSVTKPLFGVMTMSDEYVVNDKPIVLGYAYGDALAVNDTVTIKLKIPDLGVAEERSVTAFTAAPFPLSDLTVGVHDVTLSLEHGGQTDTLVRTITVFPSRLTKTTSSFSDVTPGMAFDSPSDARSTLLFSDTGRGRILATLESLQWSWGKRLDRSLAARVARETIKDLDEKLETGTKTIPLAEYQQQDGGISLMTYGDPDLRLTAFAAARADLFDRARLRDYLEEKLSEKNASLEQIGYALLGLAYLGEPVLPDLESYLALEGITDEHRLVAALAYASLGANNQAYTIAKALLDTYGETQEPFIRLDLGESPDAKIIHTAEFSILAEALKLNERLGLGEYLGRNFPKDSITNLERALAMRAAVPNLDDVDVSFRYRLGGEEKTAELKDRRTYPLSVTPQDLSAFAILEVKGPVGVTQYSLEPLDVETEPIDDLLHIDRSYSVYGGAKRPIQVGDIVKVTLTPKVAKGVLDQGLLAIDELPSGLVLLARPWERGIGFDQDQGYPIEIDGQRITFYTSGNKAFFYYARVLAPGIYAAEPAILQGDRSRDIVNYSGAQLLEIR